MRFHQQPVGLLHNGNDNGNIINGNREIQTTTNGTTLTTTTTNTNIINQNATSQYFTDDNNDDNTNITITNDSVTYTRNLNHNLNDYLDNNRTDIYQNNINKLNNINETYLNRINDNEKRLLENNRNIVNNQDTNLNEEDLSRYFISSVYESNHNYNDNHAANFGRRENLTKLDLDTNRRHHIEGIGGDGLSIYSESSPDDSFIEDEDILSPTPSSCASLSSPEPNFPRGIINPNYPGFQHLAHTLSEHFADHHFENSSDSDISEEFEIELSNENINGNDDNIINNNNNDILTCNIDVENGNGDEDSINEESNVNLLFKNEPKVFCDKKILYLPELKTIEPLEIIETEVKLCNQQSVDGSSDEKESNSSGDQDTNSDEDEAKIVQQNNEISVDNDNADNADTVTVENESIDDITINKKETIINSCETANISCDLDTYLNSFDLGTDLKMLLEEKQFNDDTMILEKKESNEEPILEQPDILIKDSNGVLNDIDNNKLNQFGNVEKAEKDFQPDLLKNTEKAELHESFNENSVNVGSKDDNDQIEYNIGNNYDESIELNCCVVPEVVPVNNDIKTSKCVDCVQGNTTPVDIVGDFGREIEREIGLIVSGYKNKLDGATTDIAIALENDKQQQEQGAEQKTMSSEKTRECPLTNIKKNNQMTLVNDKMTDAALSNAKETITTTLSKLKTIENDHPEAETTQFNKKQLVAASILPSKLCVSEELYEKYDQNRIIRKTNNNNIIPTAIVKPKYQKSSYDDRQLPPLGCIDRGKPWYMNYQKNNSLTNSFCTIQQTRKVINQQQQQQQLLPHFERRTTKLPTNYNDNNNKKIISGVIVSDKEAFNSLRQSEKDIDCSNNCNSSSVAIVQPRKKDKMETRQEFIKKNKILYQQYQQKQQQQQQYCLNNNNNNNNNTNNNINTSNYHNNNNNNNGYNKSSGNYLGTGKEKKNSTNENSVGFDVYNIETALPVIDLEAIENHLKAAKEEERRRRNDREEIRRRLAMGAEDDYFSRLSSDKPGRKPSLQSRLQSGMNLQICFMNETASDTESPSSDSESCPKLTKSRQNNLSDLRQQTVRNNSNSHPYNSRPLSVTVPKKSNGNSSALTKSRPSSLSLGPPLPDNSDVDFFTRQARLQIEARMALAQAKDMAHMQMEIERQKLKQSPITEVIRCSLEKVGIVFPPEKRRVSRQMLTDMNIAQLQVIVNELHTQIEHLNEQLVQYLMERDELHMSQDSMLVDIEDLTRYLGAKEQTRLKDGHKFNKLTDIDNNKCSPTGLVMTKSTNSLSNLTITTSPTIGIVGSGGGGGGGGTATVTAATSPNITKQQNQRKLLRISSLVKK